jgi:transposase-like protein
MKEGDVIELEVYGEICCDHCEEIIHNHIDCPVCKNTYAPTEQYHYIDSNEDIVCQECESVFELVKEGEYASWYNDDKVKAKIKTKIKKIK